MNPKENREGGDKSAFLLKATKSRHKRKLVTTSPVTNCDEIKFLQLELEMSYSHYV